METANEPTRNRLGDFEIVRELGRGGMGVVFEARQVTLNRKVALKVLASGLGLTPRAVERFHREAEAAAKLHHTNIVPVYATGEQEGTHFYAMELIEGPSLDHVIRRLRQPTGTSVEPTAPELLATGPYVQDSSTAHSSALSGSSLRSGGTYFDTVAKMIADVADALDHVHKNGVVHRDIKPSNLLLSSDGRLSVNDFGLARMLEQPGMTVTGEFMGTPAYMSPEQITAGRTPLDHRTDIYSFGATLYELLTLQPPFPGERRDQVLAQIIHKEPKAPRSLNKKVPVDLETICLKAMDRDPDRRYQSGKDMADDLRRFVNRFAISARRPGPLERLRKWARRHPGLAAALACLLVAVAAAGYFAYRAYEADQKNQANLKEAAEQLRAEKRQNALDRAFVAAMSGDFVEANRASAEAEDLGASTEQVRMLRGLVHIARGEAKQAVAELKPAVERMPQSVAALALLAQACVEDGQFEQSLMLIDKARTLTPITAADYLFLGRVLSGLDPEMGRELADHAIELRPGSPLVQAIRADVWIAHATMTGALADAQDTVAAARSARDMLPGNPVPLAQSVHAQLVLANAYESAGQEKERGAAMEAARIHAEALVPFRAVPVTRLAWLQYLEVVDDPRALEEYRLAYEDRVVSGGVEDSYANLLYRAGRVKDALQVLQERPGSGLGHLQLATVGHLLADLGRRDEALASFEKGFQGLDKAGLDIERLYTQTILLVLGEKQRAAEVCQKIGVRDSPLTRRRGGWYLRLAEFNRGSLSKKELLEKAGPSRWNQCEAHFFIAMQYLAVGGRDEARGHFGECVKTRVYLYIDYQWSRTFLARMKQDPEWPRRFQKK